jgi:hypothetical protein
MTVTDTLKCSRKGKIEMSRSGYSEDCETWDMIRWRGAVKSAIEGARGQAFLKELLAALDAMPEHKLIKGELEYEGNVCAIGAVGRARGVDMSNVDAEDCDVVARVFGIAPALAAEIVFENDEAAGYWRKEAPEARWARMRNWVVGHIRVSEGAAH